jgi:hypothetical protein
MSRTNPRQQAKEKGALRTAVFFFVVVVVAQVMVIADESTFRYRLGRNHLLALRLSYIAFSIVVLALVLLCGNRLSDRVMRTVPLLFVAPAFALTWVAHVAYSRARIDYSAFLGYKLAFLVLSLAPGPGVLSNALMILAFLTEAVVLWYFGGVSESQQGALSAEPWVTVLFACAAILILVFQNAYRRMNRQLGEMTVRENVIKNLSGLSLAVRDKINSPLQTLEICFEVLPKNEVTTAGRRSLDTIEESIRPLREFDRLIDWEQKEFPSPETLVKQLREDLQDQDAAFHLRSTENDLGTASTA